jgi:hypothetical protein
MQASGASKVKAGMVIGYNNKTKNRFMSPRGVPLVIVSEKADE